MSSIDRLIFIFHIFSIVYTIRGAGAKWSHSDIFKPVSYLPAKAVDSRLEFLERKPVRYTLLLGKNFPKLSAFTISCWLKLISEDPPGTLMSYATRRGEELQLTIGNGILLNVSGSVLPIPVQFARSVWIHLAITWTGTKGKQFHRLFMHVKRKSCTT